MIGRGFSRTIFSESFRRGGVGSLPFLFFASLLSIAGALAGCADEDRVEPAPAPAPGGYTIRPEAFWIHTAEGGAIVCRDAELLDRCRLFTNFGIRNEWTVETAGLNGKLDEIRSALGLVNLKRVDEGIRSRERVVRSYLDFFRSLAHESIRVNPHLYEDPDVELNYTYFPIVVAPSARLSRDILYRKLRERRIHSRTYYFPTVLDLPVYERYDFRTGDVSNAAYLSRNVLCLPVNPYFDEEDVAYITGCLADILGKR